jgi:hypothetical protein
LSPAPLPVVTGSTTSSNQREAYLRSPGAVHHDSHHLVSTDHAIDDGAQPRLVKPIRMRPSINEPIQSR